MKQTKLSDSEILSLLNHGIKAGVRYTDTTLAAERRKVEDYYNGKLPAPSHAGNSRYVSTDVYDTVESAKSTLLEAFSAHSEIVQFAPKGEDDVEMARIATEYAKHVVFEQNPGIGIFSDVVHGSLTSRRGIAKVYWEKNVEEIEEAFEDLTEDQLDEMLLDEETSLVEMTIDEDTLLLTGKLLRKEDKSQVRIVALPMEEFIVNPNIKSLEDAPSITHRTEKSKDELIQEGYKKALVNKISNGDRDELAQDADRINRYAPVGGDGIGLRDEANRQEGTTPLVVHETYARLNIDGTKTKMWRIVHCGDVILDKEQVGRHPFFSYAAIPTPHRFWAENFALRVIPTQNAKTVLVRSILDHAVLANNPRYGVVKGALTNPRELLDNRIGGLVNVTRQDGIFPIPQAPLNPFVFQTIGLLDDDKEDVTGVSRLSQGLNKDAISSQNSQGMVEQLIGASMQRQKSMARNFATQFLGPLFLEVYRLVVENETKERVIAIAGNWVPVTPSSWRRQRDVVIDLRLGYGEREQLAREFVELGTMLAQDESIKHLHGPQERYALYKAFLETKGHRNVSAFLKNPNEVEPPQPDPLAMLEMELRKQEIAINERKQTLAEKKVEQADAIAQMRADMDRRFKTLEFALKTQDSERKAAETENRIEVSQAEIGLAIDAQSQAPEENQKATAIISPNG